MHGSANPETGRIPDETRTVKRTDGNDRHSRTLGLLKPTGSQNIPKPPEPLKTHPKPFPKPSKPPHVRLWEGLVRFGTVLVGFSWIWWGLGAVFFSTWANPCHKGPVANMSVVAG